MRVLVHAPGPPGHGVVRHAAAVARAAAAHGVETVATDPDVTHAQFTDALYGPDIATAAAAYAAWAVTAPRPLLVTLHDVPGADPDPARDTARGCGYARVVAASDAVVVSAVHEAVKLERLTGRQPAVIPLPVTVPSSVGPRPAWAGRLTLGVLGYVYPGKGHDTVIDAAGRHPDRPAVVVAGSASPGHGGLLAALHARGAGQGVDLLVTGPLADADMAAAAGAVTLPVAPGAAVSASGSLATWLGCGRRPLAARGEYTDELAARHPGVLHRYAGPDELDAAVAAALADPVRTWFAGPARRPDAGVAVAPAGPGRRPDAAVAAALADPGPVRWPDVGAEHAALYARLVAC